MSNNVTFISVYKENKISSKLKAKINKSVNLKLFKNSNFIDIEKIRYVNNKSFSKCLRFITSVIKLLMIIN